MLRITSPVRMAVMVIWCAVCDAVLVGGSDMPYPPATKDLHHEMELVVAIGTGGRDIAESDALTHVWGYCAGLDMTRRDLQNAAKKTGRPWDMGKGFDHSAPMGGLVPARKLLIYGDNLGFFAGLDALVVSERTSLVLISWSPVAWRPYLCPHSGGLWLVSDRSGATARPRRF